MDFLYHRSWIEQIRFARAGRAPAHIHTGDSPLAAQDNSATRQGFVVLHLTDFDPGHIRDRII